MSKKILIADDELLIRNFLKDFLKEESFEITLCENGKQAIEALKNENFDIVITDMKMPIKDGFEVLKFAKKHTDSLVIIMTAFGSIENAVEAMKLGAFNYLIKPFSLESIKAILEKAFSHINLIRENRYLRNELSYSFHTAGIISNSPSMKKILNNLKKIAQSNSSVFINGESGTGKEIFAHAIHHLSKRFSNPFIKVNCAAIPETLIESEFFGHEKGSFTGADQKKIGKFELANKGSLLLDEITEIPLLLQPKLLRAIQEQEFERVGGINPIKVDIRFISTSNRNIKEAISSKIFREDLFYRLNVVPINLPPLRERKEDIIPLAEYFLKTFSQKNKREKTILSSSSQKKLLNYSWPGNIRELSNIIERAVVLNSSSIIEEEHLYIDYPKKEIKESYEISLKDMEKSYILKILQENNFNKTKAANILKISLRTLRNKLREYQN
ncbi:MAG: tRNA(5-methylaminomethyl-2-thiouridylate) methyltransferase [Chlamydiae bacterium SM23_39]|nr:MAG: tRNA(5-methylaminomethyl-2-thiouridylate) methyltransferase [Chlamydiae bacterium SM23_39]